MWLFVALFIFVVLGLLVKTTSHSSATAATKYKAVQELIVDIEKNFTSAKAAVAAASERTTSVQDNIASGNVSGVTAWKQSVMDLIDLHVTLSRLERELNDSKKTLKATHRAGHYEKNATVEKVQFEIIGLRHDLIITHAKAAFLPPSFTPVVAPHPEPIIPLPEAFDGTSRAAWFSFRVSLENVLTVDWRAYNSSDRLMAVLLSVLSDEPLEYLTHLPRPETSTYTSAAALCAAAKPTLDQIEQLYGQTHTARRIEGEKEYQHAYQNDRPFQDFFDDFMAAAKKAGRIGEFSLLGDLRHRISPELSSAVLTRLGYSTSVSEFRDAWLYLDPVIPRARSAPCLPARAVGVGSGLCWDCGGRFRKRHMCEQKKVVQEAFRGKRE